MIFELEIPIGAVKAKAFLQRGFFLSSVSAKHFHSHNYTEIHLVSGGVAHFQVEDRTYEVSDGAMLVIPREIFHRCLSQDESARHTAFQLDREVEAISVHALPQGIATDFLDEIPIAQERNHHAKIAAYIALFCSFFDSTPRLSIQSVSDYGFLIHEFFSLHYKENLHLCDLARELHLSERQAERLVLIHTGRTFREELIRTRLAIAHRLMQSSSLSKNEIAEYVGYKSYAGFWKAIKKYPSDQSGSEIF